MDINTLLALAAVLLSIPAAAVTTVDAFSRRRMHTVGRPTQAPPSDVTRSVGRNGPTWGPPGTVTERPTARSTSAARESVSLPRRILAYFVDFYAWALASVMVESLFIDLNDPQANPTGLGFLVGWVAMSALVASTGRTPGKLLVGGRLVSTANPDGEVSFGIAMWRYAVASVVSFLLISQLSALGNDERRTLHDRWTKTRVVRTR